jgi:hypothetical protein
MVLEIAIGIVVGVIALYLLPLAIGLLLVVIPILLIIAGIVFLYAKHEDLIPSLDFLISTMEVIGYIIIVATPFILIKIIKNYGGLRLFKKYIYLCLVPGFSQQRKDEIRVGLKLVHQEIEVEKSKRAVIESKKQEAFIEDQIQDELNEVEKDIKKVLAKFWRKAELKYEKRGREFLIFSVDNNKNREIKIELSIVSNETWDFGFYVLRHCSVDYIIGDNAYDMVFKVDDDKVAMKHLRQIIKKFIKNNNF